MSKHFPGAAARLFVKEGDALRLTADIFPIRDAAFIDILICGLLSDRTPPSQTSFETISATASSPMWISLNFACGYLLRSSSLSGLEDIPI